MSSTEKVRDLCGAANSPHSGLDPISAATPTALGRYRVGINSNKEFGTQVGDSAKPRNPGAACRRSLHAGPSPAKSGSGWVWSQLPGRLTGPCSLTHPAGSSPAPSLLPGIRANKEGNASSGCSQLEGENNIPEKENSPGLAPSILYEYFCSLETFPGHTKAPLEGL